MEIDLKLFVTLAKYRPKGGGSYHVQDGSTVAGIMEDLGIPKDEVKLIFINGRKAPEDQTLSPGDRVGLFPPVGGG